MKTEKKSFEPFLSIIKIIYMCGVLLYFLFVTRDAWGQTVHPAIDNRPVVLVSQTDQQRNKVRQIYLSQLGVREKQPNSGPEVEKYLRYVNLSKGNPWCAAFVCWVYGEAGVGNPRTGWSPGLFGARYVIWEKEPGTKNQEPRHPPIVPSAYPPGLVTQMEPGTKNQDSRRPQYGSPRMGDVFGLYFPEKGRIAHVGFIDEWKDAWVTTVEGNTNVLGSREGDGVYRKRRLVRSIYKVARYVQ